MTPSTNVATPVAGSRLDVTRALELIQCATAPMAGRRFLDALVGVLTTELGLAYAFVGHRSKGDPAVARTLTVAHGGRPVADLAYPLKGTPCAEVLGYGSCIVPCGARARYPDDPALVEMTVESYVGIRLSYDGGRVLGWLAVMHTDQVARDAGRIMAVLSGVAARTSLEMERLQVETVLADAHRTLEARVAERTVELETANEALRQSEEKFASAFRCCPDALVITCLGESRVLDVNDSMLRMTGYTRHEALGKTIDELRFWVHEDQRQETRRILANGGVIRDLEFEFRIKGGHQRRGRLSAEGVRLGQKLCVVAVITMS